MTEELGDRAFTLETEDALRGLQRQIMDLQDNAEVRGRGTLLQDNNGQLSTMRVLTVFVVTAVVGTWCAMSIMQGQFIEIPIQSVGLVLGSLGLKGWQRRGEY